MTGATPTPLPQPARPPVDAEAVRRAALTCVHVAALSAGEHGEAATYLPGERVVGVQVRDDSVVLHVVARYGVAARDLAGAVRAAVAQKVAGRRVDVVIADIQLPAEPAGAGTELR